MFNSSVRVEMQHREQVVYNQSPIIRRDDMATCFVNAMRQLQAAELSSWRLLTTETRPGTQWTEHNLLTLLVGSEFRIRIGINFFLSYIISRQVVISPHHNPTIPLHL